MSSSSYRKIFAIGDIHGCRDKLARLLSQLPYERERDLLIFLGDYINRGPESREVIALLCALQKSGGRMICKHDPAVAVTLKDRGRRGIEHGAQMPFAIAPA